MGGELPPGTTAPRGLPSPRLIRWPLVPARELFELKYGKSLVEGNRRAGSVCVYGTNGPCGTHDEALFAGPGVIIGRKGQGPLGVEWSERDYWVIDTAYSLKPLRADVHLRYAYYLIKHIGLNHLKDGTSNPTLSRDSFGAQALPLPPLDKQRAIAHILGTLDGKIELNRRMNETLEAMARALFKSWFVEFDPVHAKAERLNTGFADSLGHHFPASLEHTEHGDIPTGWHTARLSEFIEVTRGLSYTGAGLSSDGLPMHNLNSILEGGGYKYDGLKFYDGVWQSRHVVHAGDLIVANTEQGHDRLLIGYAAIIPRRFAGTSLFSHHLYRVRAASTSYLTADFLYHLLNSDSTHDILSGYANGTTVNMLPIDALQRPLVLVPPAGLVRAFNDFAAAARARIEGSVEESSTLSGLRDALLPKLISGELQVVDAEKLVGGRSWC